MKVNKLKIGSLLRIVSSKKWEKLSENLDEVSKLRESVPKLSKYIEHISD